MKNLSSALALAAALASPASAAETCPIERAIYTVEHRPGYTLTFEADKSDWNQLGYVAVLKNSKGKIADISFGWGNGGWVGWSAPSIEQGGLTYIFNEDFSWSEIGPAAPHAIILADLYWTEEGGTRGPDGEWTLSPRGPFGAWILATCR
ncbi:hypothetical protein [Parvibaculum sp.]|uniref:hypothetical protein n=1 Tax=Parvibaculum sp. TaxID=2024848 RepID=UPI00261FEC10|nr:hypothetical protein [Parvibaculum sp.]MCW5728160.1 hypothetical protein [Parvibaculum sp.]